MRTIKEELRQAMRLRRGGLDAAFVEAAGVRVCQRLSWLTVYRVATVVLGYLATGREVPTWPALEHALRSGKRTFVPSAATCWFAEYHSGAPLRLAAWRIAEPLGTPPFVAAGEVGIVLVPVVAWDSVGRRLGRGAGWYDRVLPRLAMPRIGVGYDFQEQACVPTDTWDVRLDYVVTESRLIDCGSAASGERLP